MLLRHPRAVLRLQAAILAALCFAPEGQAQLAQQGPKLVGSGTIGVAKQGTSVSLSSDGNTAIVGGPGDNGGAGAAWIFIRSGGVWLQQGDKLVGTGAVGNAQQGFSVSLSGDGNTAIVGGPDDDIANARNGAAWIFTRSEGVWLQQSKLVGAGGLGSRIDLGYSVSLSADGNTAIVGGPFDNILAGAAWIFTRNEGLWTQQAKLVGTNAANAAFEGAAVSLSSDGNTAVVGGPADYGGDGSAGATWVFSRRRTVWTQQAKLVGTGAVGLIPAHQGHSVSLSSDGNTAIVGGPWDDHVAGAAWIFSSSFGVWRQEGGKLAGTGVPFAELGTSVSISGDGNTAIVGSRYDDLDLGAALVFNRSSGAWTPQGTKLAGKGAVGPANQGASVAVAADATTAIVGGPNDNLGVGAAWIFTTPADLASADLAVTQSITTGVGGGLALPNSAVNYAITVANNGPGLSTGISVTDVLPAKVTFAFVTPSQGSCSGTTAVICTLGTLAAGASATISLGVTTGAGFGPVNNSANVTAATPDPNPDNNSSTATVNIVPASQLRRRAV
jgi:uncharacterized repeat protein (TIGR01451 family)